MGAHCRHSVELWPVLMGNSCLSEAPPNYGGCLHMVDHPQNLQHHAYPAWSYDNASGAHGPHEWGSLCSQFSAARTGTAQSPVDIASYDCDEAAGPKVASLDWRTEAAGATVLNNRHCVQVNWTRNAPGGKLHLNGKVYHMVQLHCHTPSEHTIDGMTYPLEMHMMHYTKDYDLAVIAVLFKCSDSSNPFLRQYFNPNPFNPDSAVPTKDAQDRFVNAVSFDSINLNSSGHYSYRGSLTTPPCTEAVQWFIMKDVQEASQIELDAFTDGTCPQWKAVGGNRRPTQDLGNRRVTTYDPSPTIVPAVHKDQNNSPQKDSHTMASPMVTPVNSPAADRQADTPQSPTGDQLGAAAESISPKESPSPSGKKKKKDKKAHKKPGGNWMKSKNAIQAVARASQSPRTMSESEAGNTPRRDGGADSDWGPGGD